MEMVNVIIDGKSVEVEKGSTVLLAAQKAGVHIPTLCYLKDVNAIGACRVCLVEVKGAKALQPACVYPVSDGLEVHTNTPKVREARKAVVELLLSNHPGRLLDLRAQRQLRIADYGSADGYQRKFALKAKRALSRLTTAAWLSSEILINVSFAVAV